MLRNFQNTYQLAQTLFDGTKLTINIVEKSLNIYKIDLSNIIPSHICWFMMYCVKMYWINIEL